MGGFYRHPRMADGHLGKCKECARKDAKKRTVARECLICGKRFLTWPTEIKRGGGKTCSRECFYRRLPGVLASKFDEEFTNKKMSYAGVHLWISRRLGQPNYCEHCKSQDPARTYDWSNRSGEYKRELTDWLRLCRACHIQYDGHTIKRKETISTKYNWKVE